MLPFLIGCYIFLMKLLIPFVNWQKNLLKIALGMFDFIGCIHVKSKLLENSLLIKNNS